MSQYNDTGCGTIVLSGTVSQYTRITAGGALASATQQDVGVARVDGVSGQAIGFVYANKQGTQIMIAAGAISAGAKVYTAASGRVSATQATGSFLRGIAMSASTAAGDHIEVMSIVGDSAGT
jgi:hypothetical protein